MNPEDIINTELVKVDNYYTSIDNRGPNYHQNLERRMNALNNFFFNDNDEDIFRGWYLISQHDCNEQNNCICGKDLHKEFFLIVRKNISCSIGSVCIKNFSPRLYKVLNDTYNRKTFDCDDCIKRISNSLKDTHGICIECKGYVNCKYKICWDCRNPPKCKDCNKIIDRRFKNTTKRCYICYQKFLSK